MKNLSSFLKKETNISVEKLVKTTVKELKKTSFASDLVTRLVAMLTVLRGLGSLEEVHFAGLLIISHFGAKGQVVPVEVSTLFSPITAPTAPASRLQPQQVAPINKAPTAVAPPPAPKPVAIAPPTPAKAQTAPAPARTLQNPPVDSKKWFKLLRDIIGGKHDQKTMKGVQSLTIQIFRDGFKLVAEDWKLFFTALQAANIAGQHIVEKQANPAMIFRLAPVELVRGFLFGQDGFLVTLVADIADCGNKGMEPWMCGKTAVAIDAVSGLDSRSKLTDPEAIALGGLVEVLKAKKGPPQLIQMAEDIVNAEDLEAIHRRAQTPSNVMEEKLKKAGLKSSKEPEPAAPVAHKMSNSQKKKAAKKSFSMPTGAPPTTPVAATEAPAVETVTTATAEATSSNTAEPAAPPAETATVIQQVTSAADNDDKLPPEKADETTLWVEEQLRLEAEQNATAVSATQPINGHLVEPPPPSEAPATEATIQ